jgi:8-oxo-dGTP pyrophosphatase MutT (NUDIX family)
MTLSSTINETIEAAASVVLLRDGDAGLEVFLMRRAVEASAYGGMHVFPGGKLDPADRALESTRLDRSARELHAALGERALTPTDAVAIHVAALRELFEESGVLLASDMQGSAGAGLQSESARGRAFNEMVHAGGLRLATRALAPWSRWITPVMPGTKRRRFDTRFFVASMPPRQTAEVADHESTLGTWLRPAQALTLYWQRDIDLAAPQIFTLSQLNRHPRAQDALDAARSRPPPLIEPHHFAADGQRMICYPGDPAHPIGEAAFPGMPRLIFRDGRFEPLDGVDALIG